MRKLAATTERCSEKDRSIIIEVFVFVFTAFLCYLVFAHVYNPIEYVKSPFYSHSTSIERGILAE